MDNKPLHINTTFNGKQAERLKKLAVHDIGVLKYSSIIRIAFDYYCENNEQAITKLNEK